MNNKIPCGGFYLSDTLGVDENGKLGVNGGEPYKSLVTDGEGNVKWEDRLAYIATGEQVIFSQENIAFTEGNGKHDAGPLDMPETINVGEKYRVNFDGETYDCIAYSDPLDLHHTVNIGNGFIIGMPYDTGEPFVILNPTGPTEIMIVTSLTSPTHTVSIAKAAGTVHTIPQKFLPDPTVFYVDSNDNLTDAEGVKITLEQAKAVGLNFIIQTDSGVSRPISAFYGDTYASFYVAKALSGTSYNFSVCYAGGQPIS